MRDDVEFGKRHSAEEGMVATAEWGYIKDKSSLRKLSGEPNTTSKVTVPELPTSIPGITPLEVVLLGLIRDGLIPIFHTQYNGKLYRFTSLAKRW